MKFSQDIASDWQKHVEAFERSGMTRRRYCERHQIRPYQLDYWRKKFRKSHSAAEGPETDWIPLQVEDDRVNARPSGICLRLGRLTIEVKPGFDPELLGDVVRALGPAC